MSAHSTRQRPSGASLLGRPWVRLLVGRVGQGQNPEGGVEGRLGRWLEALEGVRRALPGLGEMLGAA